MIAAFSGDIACLSLSTSPLAVMIAGGLVGLGHGTLLSAMQVGAAQSVPPHWIGIAVSNLLMLDAGTGAGPPLPGWSGGNTIHGGM